MTDTVSERSDSVGYPGSRAFPRMLHILHSARLYHRVPGKTSKVAKPAGPMPKVKVCVNGQPNKRHLCINFNALRNRIRLHGQVAPSATPRDASSMKVPFAPFCALATPSNRRDRQDSSSNRNRSPLPPTPLQASLTLDDWHQSALDIRHPPQTTLGGHGRRGHAVRVRRHRRGDLRTLPVPLLEGLLGPVPVRRRLPRRQRVA